jgi:hypothetical protein
MTCRAVSASTTVPAPTIAVGGSDAASVSISETAPGTVIVTSSARMPPSRSASTTGRSSDGCSSRMTAITPACSRSRTTVKRSANVTTDLESR